MENNQQKETLLTGLYSSNLVLTQKQKQDDQDHGIYEGQKKNFSIDMQSKLISFSQHYYYQYEAYYQIVTQTSVDAQLKGSFIQNQKGQYTCFVKGKYLYENLNQGVKIQQKGENSIGQLKIKVVKHHSIDRIGIQILDVDLKSDQIKLQNPKSLIGQTFWIQP